jgi:4-amino-4-deoxy-L-arabinose transferase-like glycosyltransferase
MPNWAAILLLIALGFVLGRLLLEQFARARGRFDGDWLANAFASLTLGLAIIGWLALVLAELGWYSLGLLAIFWSLLTAILAIRTVRNRRLNTTIGSIVSTAKPSRRPLLKFLPSWTQYLILGLWLIAAGWLFFRPHEYVTGAADAGVYVNLAANIAESGSILIEDPTLAELDQALYPAFLRPQRSSDYSSTIAPYTLLPGFYVTEAADGVISPQFYPLHAVWQAIAYDLGGIQTALLITGLWALLGTLSVYLVVREIAGWEIAIVALVGLSINALQIWFARYPTTEALTQYLLWAGLWALVLWLRQNEPQPWWGFLAGLTLGELFLVRIDTYFLLILPFFIWLWLRWTGRWEKHHWTFFAPIALLTVHSLLHAIWQSAPYFYNTFGYGVNLLRSNWLIPVTALFIGAGLLLVLGRFRNKSEILGRYQRPFLMAAAISVAILAIYGYFIRPNLGGPVNVFEDWYSGGQIPEIDRENLVRLGWYLSPLGIFLATAGTCLMLLRADRQSSALLAVGLMFSLLYLWRIQANPHQVYAMRRYVPAVVPFATVATCYLLGWLFRQKRAWLSATSLLLTVLWLAGLGWSARGFISQVDRQGIVAQLDQFDSMLAPQSVVLFNDEATITNGDIVGTPLHFIYGHDVYSLRDKDALDEEAFLATIEAWQASGRDVYWVGDRSLLEEFGLEGDETFTITIHSQNLEGTYERKPVNILTANWDLTVTHIG